MIYFDHSATSYPKPECVKRAVYESFDTYGNAGRGTYALSLQASRLIYKTREYCKTFFDAPQHAPVVFTSGATESLNIIIKGMLQSSDHVITTTLEHNSVLRPLYDMQKHGVELSFLSCDDEGVLNIEQIEEQIQNNTKMLICTHASNITGNVNDVKAIGEICHKHDIIFVVDAAQSAGHYPFSMIEDGIDILCFSGHKGLLSPTGIGGIIMKQEYIIQPFISGGTGFDSFSKQQPSTLPERLEAGTMPIHAIAGLYAGLKYIHAIGVEHIHKKEIELATLFYERLIQFPDVRVIGDFKSSQRCAIVSFIIDGYTSDEIVDILSNEYDIAVRGGAHCAPLIHEHFHTTKTGLIRFSFGYENTEKEVNTALDALRQIVSEHI